LPIVFDALRYDSCFFLLALCALRSAIFYLPLAATLCALRFALCRIKVEILFHFFPFFFSFFSILQVKDSTDISGCLSKIHKYQ
jgi:hypothetical protein